jgi:glycosyltransferase involved in cell wall biosynthesis
MKILDDEEEQLSEARPSSPSSATHTPEVSVFLPVFNEEPNLRPLHAKLDEALKSLGYSAEIVYVDDGSTDGSLTILREIAELDPRVRVVALRRNYGQTAAMAAGIDAAKGKVLIPMDADLQNDPADITRRGLRRRLRLAQKPERQNDHAQDTFNARESPDLVDRWRAAARLRLFAEGLPARVVAGRALVRRDAPLHSNLCSLGRS